MTDMDKMMIEKVAEAIYDFLDERFPDGALPGGTQLFADDHLDAEFKHEAGCEEMARAIVSAYNPDDRLSQEVENLTHDLERQMTIANIECNLAEDAREALRQCRRLAAMETSALAGAIIETVDRALSPLPQGMGDNAIGRVEAMLFKREIEKAWRDGWSTGYNAGLRDGRSDGTYWCDEEADWKESASRNDLDRLSPNLESE